MKKTLILLIAAAALGTAGAQQTTPTSAPALVGKTWIGSSADIQRAKDFRGHVTILHFWTFGCINCKHNLPHYAKWAKLFDPKQVTIIGVHTPETPGERIEANVVREIHRHGITYPVLVDNQSQNWDRYHQQFWPAVYVIDQKGQIRGKWEGELQYNGQDGEAQVRELVGKLLADKSSESRR
jgi:thiol-disulfide isomerase/thioredoxin